MNYRHAFHAGNFADLVKHAMLLRLLAELGRGPTPLTVIDTHAGRGLYDLAGSEARKSGEAEAGVARLMRASDAPVEFNPLMAAVTALNPDGALRRYPGSPWLIANALRPQDRYVACELRPEEHAALQSTLAGRGNVVTLCGDGYAAAAARCPPRGSALVLIDPPFEQPDDYERVVAAATAVRRRNPGAAIMAWLPLKDLETFDRFLRDLEDAADAPLLVGEARVRPLTDPLKMNGCALALLGADGLEAPLAAICAWVAQALGDGGLGRAYRLSSS